MPIKLFEILVDRINTTDFQTDALKFFRDVNVSGNTIDATIVSATLKAIKPMVTTQSTLDIFLRDLNGDQATVDKIILDATKNILSNPIEDQRIYDKLKPVLSNTDMSDAQFQFFNDAIQKGGYVSTFTGNPDSGNYSNTTSRFPETVQLLDDFKINQLIKFKANQLTIADFNTNIERSYITLIGPIEYKKSQDDAYKLLYIDTSYNGQILEAFIPLLVEKYINENLLVSLHKNVPEEKYQEILKDLIRDKVTGSNGKVEKPIKKNILEIYQDKLDKKDATQGKIFKEGVKKSKEPDGKPLAFVVICESLSQELPVFTGLHIDPTASLNAITITIKKLIDTFGQEYFTKFFDINKLLVDLTTGLALELGPLWSTPWISSIATTIAAVSSGNATVPFMTFDQPSPNGTSQQLPTGEQFKNHFNKSLMLAHYGGDPTGNVMLLVESISEYMDDVYKLLKYTTPYPYLPSPFTS